jgi:hypothetical protein
MRVVVDAAVIITACLDHRPSFGECHGANLRIRGAVKLL